MASEIGLVSKINENLHEMIEKQKYGGLGGELMAPTHVKIKS